MDAEVTRKVTVGYTMAAANAFAQLGRQEGKKFRFIFTSGILAVKDSKERVWVYPKPRRVAVSLSLY